MCVHKAAGALHASITDTMIVPMKTESMESADEEESKVSAPREDDDEDDEEEEEEEEEAAQEPSTRKRRTSTRTMKSSAKKGHTVHVKAQRRLSTQRTYVEHRYHDHLHDASEQGFGTTSISDLDSVTKKQRPRGGVTVAFPEKLHEMLSKVETEGISDVISWQPHGRCFLIHKKREFVQDIMPRFFHQTKLTSFQRQLNLYGFVRLTARRDRGGYYHELFLRGRPDLCRRMVRTRIKGNGMKAASSPETEPNFYLMEPCGEDGPVDHNQNHEESRSSTSTESGCDHSSLQHHDDQDQGSDDDDDGPPMDQNGNNRGTHSDNNKGGDHHVSGRGDVKEKDFTQSSGPSSFGCSDEMKTVFYKMLGVSSDLPASNPMTLKSFAPMLISPPSSPSHGPFLSIPDLQSCLPMPSSAELDAPLLTCSMDLDDEEDCPALPAGEPAIPEPAPSCITVKTPDELHSGDAVFFEGHKFRYLDNIDFADLVDSRVDASHGEGGVTIDPFFDSNEPAIAFV